MKLFTIFYYAAMRHTYISKIPGVVVYKDVNINFLHYNTLNSIYLALIAMSVEDCSNFTIATNYSSSYTPIN